MTSNKRRRHTPDQIIRKLAEGNKLLAAGQELDEVCRHLEIAESTWHRWLAQYGGMKANDAKRLKELEARERPAQEAGRQPGARHRHAQGDLGGKLLTPNRKRSAVHGAARPVRGLRTSSLHGGGHPPLHDAPDAAADHRRGGRAARLAAPVLHRPAALGVATGSQDGPPSGLAGQQQAHPPAVARGGPAGAAAPHARSG